MTLIAGYICRQTLLTTLLLSFFLTAVVWLSQGLRMLDIVINSHQSVATFFQLTIYVLPSLFALVLPISLFCAVLYTINRFYADGEVIAMFSAGLGNWAIAQPILIVGVVTTGVGLFISLYLMPLGYRAMRDKIFEIRSDITSSLFREGAFTYPANGFTVFVREIAPSGALRGIFVYGNDPARPLGTITAESGQLVRTDRGPMLIVRDGTWIRDDPKVGPNPTFVHFSENQFLLDEIMKPQDSTPQRQYDDRYLLELLYPNQASAWDMKNRSRLISEAHARLTAPLYNLALPLIALVSLLSGSYSRRGMAGRIAVGVAIALMVRLAGIGASSLVQKNLALIFIHYLVPVTTIAACCLLLNGFGSRMLDFSFLLKPAPSSPSD